MGTLGTSRPRRRRLGRLAWTMLGALAATACGHQAAARRPNVLLVTLDTTRPDYLSTYGGPAGATPNFDALAAEGARFDMAISASGVTPVSHASILTGRFPYRHGLRVLRAQGSCVLGADQETLATRFRAAGYRTGAALSSFTVSSWFGFQRGFEFFDSQEGKMLENGETDRAPWWDMHSLQRRCDATTDAALAFATTGDEPFFLWVHYWDPHDRLMVPPDDFLGGPAGEGKDLDREEVYAREVSYVDQEFGRLLDGLRSAGRYDNLLVAVAADHGEGLADGAERHGWAKHRMLYQEQIHVPCFVRVPGAAGGVVVEDVVRTVDLAPTLIDYAGVACDPAEFDGRSLRPLIEGQHDSARVAYADQINGYDENAGIAERRPDAAFLFGVVDGPWKLIFRPHMRERSELFRLDDDPGERRNVAAEHPDVVQRLLQDLARRDPWVTAPPAADGNADSILLGDALAGLGNTGSEGEAHEVSWSWTCWDHPEVHQIDRGRCPECGALLVPDGNW